MNSIATKLLFIILVSKFGVILSNTETPVFYDCGPDDSDNFYLQYDLLKLFIYLRSQANTSYGFAHTSVNDLLYSGKKIYGLIMCYADATSDDCSSCLNFSTENAAALCPVSSSAVFFYEWCFLRYENQDFISTLSLDQKPNCIESSYRLSDSISMGNTISGLLNSQRQDLDKSYLYAHDKKTYAGMDYSVYALVQCTRDLSLADCDLCLKSAIGNVSACSSNYKSVGARIQLMSCYVRYELYTLNAANNQSLVPNSEPLPPSSSGSKTMNVVAAVMFAFFVFFIIVVARVLCLRRKERNLINKDASLGYVANNANLGYVISNAGSEQIVINASSKFVVSSDFRAFQLSEILSATNNFSTKNKLGEGGFGPVYKGALPGGTQIAVKRLAGWSKQGYTEFKNEVDFLVKLRHKNLVKLLGYCLENNEKLLCYEYLPCGSLDWILFANDKIKREKLSWQTRYKIIEGISSGLQYLHIESGLKIIHRDLKPSNILLDEYMNPKIADFGLAKLFQDDQTHMGTSIIAGTQGYMAPEYVMHGMYSEKLDVYAFGMMLLEIVTGRKNGPSCHNQFVSELASYVRQHWAQGEVEILKDPALDDTCLADVQRCIHIGLLCVQDNPNNRPRMDDVNFMLRNDSSAIPDLSGVMSKKEFLLSQNSTSNIGNSNLSRSQTSSSETMPIRENAMLAR